MERIDVENATYEELLEEMKKLVDSDEVSPSYKLLMKRAIDAHNRITTIEKRMEDFETRADQVLQKLEEKLGE